MKSSFENFATKCNTSETPSFENDAVLRAIDPTKLETELGWEPKYNFDTGIAQTIEWYLNNKEWWQNILSGEYANYFDKMYGNRL